MTVFVDTNVFIYASMAGPYGAACQRLRRAIVEGDVDGVTNVLVIEELWHVSGRANLGLPQTLAADTLFIVPSVLAIDRAILEVAIAMPDVPDSLGTADRVHAATCKHHGISQIVTADESFQSISWLTRLAPTQDVVAALIEGRDPTTR